MRFSIITAGLAGFAGLAMAAPAESATYLVRTAELRPRSEYPPCGSRPPLECPSQDQICVDNPDTCSQDVDCRGICVVPEFCGGFLGIECSGGRRCVDDPRDSCDPKNGGADCGGICV